MTTLPLKNLIHKSAGYNADIVYLVECRDRATGELIPEGATEPPMRQATEDQITSLFWQKNPEGGSPSAFHPGNRSASW